MTRVVHVHWTDAASLGGWRSRKAINEFITGNMEEVHSVGMLIHEDDSKIVIVQTAGTNEVIGLFEIPKGCIKTMNVIDTVPVTVEL